MWQYATHTLRTIGPRGVFAGWGLNAVKDSVGYGAFFMTFEYVKAQGYYGFVTAYCSRHLPPSTSTDEGGTPVTKPHYALPPLFLLLAGISASLAQQCINHPLSRIQDQHYRLLPHLDGRARVPQTKKAMLRDYVSAYRKTYERCRKRAVGKGGWRRWLYRGFWWSAVRQVPSTSAGLVIFELVRRRYGEVAEGQGGGVRLKGEGCEVLVS